MSDNGMFLWVAGLTKCLYSALSNIFFAIFELNELVKTNNFPTTNEKHKPRAYIQDNEGVDDCMT